MERPNDHQSLALAIYKVILSWPLNNTARSCSNLFKGLDDSSVTTNTHYYISELACAL